MIAHRQKGRGERPRRVDLLRRSCAPLGEREKVGGDVPAVRAIAPDATVRPYYLASIATSAESNNVANSGRFAALCSRTTHGSASAGNVHGQVSRAVWATPGGERIARLPLRRGRVARPCSMAATIPTRTIDSSACSRPASVPRSGDCDPTSQRAQAVPLAHDWPAPHG